MKGDWVEWYQAFREEAIGGTGLIFEGFMAKTP
jgi:hypothetical protein